MLFQIKVPLSYELVLAVSDSETEEETRDATIRTDPDRIGLGFYFH